MPLRLAKINLHTIGSSGSRSMAVAQSESGIMRRAFVLLLSQAFRYTWTRWTGLDGCDGILISLSLSVVYL
jgi:hypothetical protein